MDREALPGGLGAVLDALDLVEDRSDRIQALIDIARGYREVGPELAERPFEEAHRVPGCESEAFVWATERPDGRLDYHFAVENPQGVSARAVSALLAEHASGAPGEDVAALDDELVYALFGRELSMGKAMGLTGIVRMVADYARGARPPTVIE